jgi:hypothetical protein
MYSTESGAGLAGQSLVLDAWRRRLHGRRFIAREDLDLASIIAELAHVSVVARTDDGFRFRLAGTAVRAAFGCESRGRPVSEVEVCTGEAAWCEGVRGALDGLAPVTGSTRRPDGIVHFWLRLPMSSDGVTADLVLCHDRYLPLEALADPDRAAREADAASRLDAIEVRAA